MGLVRTTCAGLEVDFMKSNIKNCLNCKYSCKRLFKKTYKCGIIFGLNLDDGAYGYCHMYEIKKSTL